MRGRSSHDEGIELSQYTTGAATSPVTGPNLGFPAMRFHEHSDDDRHDREDGPSCVETNQAAQVSPWALIAFYSSHALFMANNRSYEFASILFTASAFPNTLVAASIRGLSAHLASVLLSPTVGQWCGRHPSRLKPVRMCIVAQRSCIALACLGWVWIVQDGSQDPKNDRFKPSVSGTSGANLAIFACLIVLGMIERLSAVGNELVVERDWLPLLAVESPESTNSVNSNSSVKATPRAALAERIPLLGSAQPKLHILNAATKRIDLIAKLLTPLVVSGVALAFNNSRYVAAVLLIFQIISCFVELCLTQMVWSAYATLRSSKDGTSRYSSPTGSRTTSPTWPEDDARVSRSSCTTLSEQVRRRMGNFRAYARSPVFLASIAYAIEPFSVLTLAGSMSAYLLVAHYTLKSITIARTAGTAVEIVSTILAPVLISWFADRAQSHGETEGKSRFRALTKVGLLGLLWQTLTLVPATAVLLRSPSLTSQDSNVARSTSPQILITVLFASLALSRLGPFAYSLIEQQIVQMELEERERLDFSGIEMALIDLSELARWSMLGIFGRPDQFRWVSVASFASVALSLVLFSVWVRKFNPLRCASTS